MMPFEGIENTGNFKYLFYNGCIEPSRSTICMA